MVQRLNFGLYSSDSNLIMTIGYEFDISRKRKLVELSKSKGGEELKELKKSLDRLHVSSCVHDNLSTVGEGLEVILLYPHQEDDNHWKEKVIRNCWRETRRFIKNNPARTFYLFSLSQEPLYNLRNSNVKPIFCSTIGKVRDKIRYRLYKRPFGPKEDFFHSKDIEELLKIDPIYL